MTDYEYLKKNKLFEAHLRFVRALGEGYGYGPIEEAEDDENPQGDMPPMGDDPNGGAPADPNAMGGGPDMGGGMPQMDGPDMNGGGDPNAMGGDEGMPPATDGGMGDAPVSPMDGPDMGDGIPPMDAPEDDNIEIDVDDITDAQEKMNKKVNIVGKDLGKVDDRIEKLLNAVTKLETMFDRNNKEIEDLRTEFERRNPTQTEKLNLRSLDSYPYKVKPTDYWSNKSQNGNYSAYYDNNKPTSQEYVITNSDVDDFSDKEMADSFTIDDELKDLDIKRIFGI